MKRFLEYALVLLIAIGAIVAVAYGLIASMTGKERARAEAKLSEQVVNALGENALEGVTGDWDEYEEAQEKAVAARAEEAPASVRELRARWKAILEPLVVTYPPARKAKEFANSKDIKRIENGIQSRSADLDSLTPEDLAALGAFIAQYAETLQEILALSSPEGLSALEGLIRDSDALDGGVHSEYAGPCCVARTSWPRPG